MSSDEPPFTAPPGGPARRKPPTIDLTAREIEGSAPAAAQPAAGSANDARPGPGEIGAASPPAESVAANGSDQSAAAPPSDPPPRAGEGRRSVPVRGLIGAWTVGLLTGGLALTAAYLAGDRGFGLGVPEARLAAIELQLRDVAARPVAPAIDPKALDDLTARLGRLETALASPRPAATDPALANRVSALEGEVKAMAETIGNLGRRSTGAAPGAPPAAGAVQRGDLDVVTGRVAAVERAAQTLAAELAKRPPPPSGDRASRLALAAAALERAVGRGDPFTTELAAAKALGAEAGALAPLEPFAAAGVPSAGVLARELGALAPGLRETTGGGAREAGVLDKLAANAERLVRVRPLEGAAGSDPAAVVARIELKAREADIAGALAELAALPPALRAPAQAWIAKAQARAAALAASRRLAADALAGLGK